MNLNNIQHFYFLGIGGIGMSALARFFNAMGKDVSGYDKTPTALTNELIAEGIKVHFEENVSLVKTMLTSNSWTKDNSLIVYTPAVPKSHSEYVLFNDLGLNIKKRAEVLGQLTEQAQTIAVAGTHGKTTTSSLIAHILRTAGIDCSAFLGGITKNYNTNLLLSKNLKLTTNNQQPTTIVVEADEYDRSFLTLHPYITVITSLDADHLDIYGDKKKMEATYSEFAKQLKPGGKLIINRNIENELTYIGVYITYSATKAADFYAANVMIENGNYIYDIITPEGKMEKVTLGLPGMHNVENSIAATAVACQMGVTNEAIRKALKTFEGAKRRFDYQVKNDKVVYIDDYAHHPEELRACISSVKQMYPGKKVTGIFQPHLYTRTRDFVDAFAESLDLLDECILLDIYPARELPIEGVTSTMLLNRMKSKNKSLVSKADLINELSKRKLEIVLTLGAGDIDMLVEPIKNQLLKQYN
ncbi:MAG: UDP-N-acetylmuramate--L-alanine ligase [Bacteroidia bacterium]|nr:UDP-N-acetylmuramate--L-alanine ligase [Bacteroidia bacterium]